MIDATALLRLVGRTRLARLKREDPIASQRRALSRLLAKAADTRFGRDHGFAGISGIEDFQAKVPLRIFEDFWEDYWKRDFPRLAGASWPDNPTYFAKTSGTTTGASKYVPVTRPILKANNRAMLDLLSFHLVKRPESRLLAGRSFMLGGSTGLEDVGDGILAGDMSGIAAIEVPRWAEFFFYPPQDLARIPDWESRMAALAEDSPKHDIRLIGGTSSWVLYFLQMLDERPGGLDALYPNLELMVYGGVSFLPYRNQFARLLAGRNVDLREVYPASEGFLAFADRGVGEGLRLQTDGGLFYEFVPVEDLESEQPRRFWLGNVETGVNYAVVLSSPAGLFSYVIGDTVRFVSLAPPRILVTGRTSTSLSMFGEHLIEEEIQIAISEASAALGLEVPDFSVGALFPETDGGRGRHLYIVEFSGKQPGPDVCAEFIGRIDRTLIEGNDDYSDHRDGDMQMQAPELLVAPPGTFVAWMKARGKLGGQNKVPRVINDEALLRSLIAAARA